MRLIDRHGLPSFIKLDVEGFEVEALAGLTQPVPALSFEFTTIQRDLATAGIERCAALGFRLYNAALGESQALVHAEWQDCAEHRELAGGAADGQANSGDIYAVRTDSPAWRTFNADRPRKTGARKPIFNRFRARKRS